MSILNTQFSVAYGCIIFMCLWLALLYLGELVYVSSSPQLEEMQNNSAVNRRDDISNTPPPHNEVGVLWGENSTMAIPPVVVSSAIEYYPKVHEARSVGIDWEKFHHGWVQGHN